ncbi:hypothetical protein [Thiomicrorhabdus indica]|uniref:hypothetical protein n=1 Tax=Thiomicrorhabdus indica TaxID=2267253 RepID=UPI00102DE368|nr:hypothetical protein [Thiomicrorhabdus indica]
MSFYRDLLTEQYGSEIGSIVGCGLDRLERKVSSIEIQEAVQFYKANKITINNEAINHRREAVTDFVREQFY